ncbi:MAG TPA: chromophore lyase CpcT/CpeT [Phycisphaerales bacterium]|nr:chromophore lyase CpcT/CpeT [Phycisphaerales bacterium]
MRSTLPAALLIPLTLCACAGALSRETSPGPLVAAESGPTRADFDRLATLVEWMSGAFDSGDQSRGDPAYDHVQLRTAPIWTDRTDGKWLYSEHTMAVQPDRPYRQRIYRVTALGGGRFKSEVHELPGDPLAFAGAWKSPESIASLTPDRLRPSEGCALTLTDGGSAFVGGTHERDCATSLRGAAYATCEVVITAEQIVSWDRLFDAAGNQVWGAAKGGYIFRKRSK